ncbi:MAG: hypothetical protein AAGF47_07005, partial [Planctomycetota bacterium]
MKCVLAGYPQPGLVLGGGRGNADECDQNHQQANSWRTVLHAHQRIASDGVCVACCKLFWNLKLAWNDEYGVRFGAGQFGPCVRVNSDKNSDYALACRAGSSLCSGRPVPVQEDVPMFRSEVVRCHPPVKPHLLWVLPAARMLLIAATSLSIVAGRAAFAQPALNGQPPQSIGWHCIDARVLPGVQPVTDGSDPCEGVWFIDVNDQGEYYFFSGVPDPATPGEYLPGAPFSSACWGNTVRSTRNSMVPVVFQDNERQVLDRFLAALNSTDPHIYQGDPRSLYLADVAYPGDMLSRVSFSIIGSMCNVQEFGELAFRKDLPSGSSLGYNRIYPPALGDFITPAETIGDDSLCLVPNGSMQEPTEWMGVTRPTLHGQVDMVTGSPLIRRTDLELPFGGSTFRLTRTNATNDSELTRTSGGWNRRNMMWDWGGLGWMVGENPLLLIDSQVPDIVDATQPPTTYLVLDAHRTIPFQFIDDTDVDQAADDAGVQSGIYAAPPRFRARMSHNGWWARNAMPGGEPGWARYPTEFTVSLYEGRVRYTFVAVWEDMPTNLHHESGNTNNPIIESTANAKGSRQD